MDFRCFFFILFVCNLSAVQPVASIDTLPPDANVMDRIFLANDISATSDTYSANIKEELFEGDIVWTKRLKATLGVLRTKQDQGMTTFDAIGRGLWPNAIVPYTFARSFRYKAVVMQAIEIYKRKTCIEFKPYSAALVRQAGGYVEFMHGGGCYSMIGKQGGKQQISIGNGCSYIGTVIHEMMHALGFFHEQSRRDRDSFITIYWNNVNKRMWYNFQKYRVGQASTLGEPYDKSSVMHYGNYAFSINRRKTIVSKSNPSQRLGNRVGLSPIDIRQLKIYYPKPNCGGVVPVTPPTTKCVDNLPPPCCHLLYINWWCLFRFVYENCKKSCGICKKKCRIGTNDHRQCDYWKRQGFCREGSKWIKFMRKTCKGSCRFCA